VFLVVNPKGQYWNGIGWSEKGRAFFSVAQATRSLHEEGEDLEGNLVMSAELKESFK
jgi:hypothetical protein